MKQVKQKIIKSAIQLVIAITIFCAVVTVYAWFFENRKVSIDGMDLTLVDRTELEVSVSVHSVLTKDKDNDVLHFSTESGGNLKQYSIGEDKPRQALVRFSFPHMPQNVTSMPVALDVSTDTDYFIGDGAHPLLAGDGTEDGVTYCNMLTSIIKLARVQNVTEGSCSYTDDAGATHTNEACFTVSSVGEYKRFIDKTENGYEIQSSFVSLAEESVTAGADIWILLDYDAELIEQVMSANIGNPIFNGNSLSSVKYVNDMKFLLKRTEN